MTDTFATIEPVVERLRAQTVCDRIELVLVAESERALALDLEEVSEFAGVTVVPHDPMQLPAARAAGVRAATAPVVFVGETHTYPHEGWAEALIAAHEQPWTAVTPGFGNANPESALSWAGFLSDYGSWAAELPSREVEMIPIYNTAYKREALLALDPLERMLTPSDELVVRLRAQGAALYFEPAARIDHRNVSSWKPWLIERYLGGLLTASGRRQSWRWQRRALYIAASPLIPFVLLARLRAAVAAARQAHRLPRGTTPAIVLSAFAAGLGELVGYVRGASADAERRMTEYEIFRVRYAGEPAAERS